MEEPEFQLWFSAQTQHRPAVQNSEKSELKSSKIFFLSMKKL